MKNFRYLCRWDSNVVCSVLDTPAVWQNRPILGNKVLHNKTILDRWRTSILWGVLELWTPNSLGCLPPTHDDQRFSKQLLSVGCSHACHARDRSPVPPGSACPQNHVHNGWLLWGFLTAHFSPSPTLICLIEWQLLLDSKQAGWDTTVGRDGQVERRLVWAFSRKKQ